MNIPTCNFCYRIKPRCYESTNFCMNCNKHFRKIIGIKYDDTIIYHNECCISLLKLCIYCNYDRQLCWKQTWNNNGTLIYQTHCEIFPKKLNKIVKCITY